MNHVETNVPHKNLQRQTDWMSNAPELYRLAVFVAKSLEVISERHALTVVNITRHSWRRDTRLRYFKRTQLSRTKHSTVNKGHKFYKSSFYYLPRHKEGMTGNVLMSGKVHSICMVSVWYLSVCNIVAGISCFALPCLVCFCVAVYLYHLLGESRLSNSATSARNCWQHKQITAAVNTRKDISRWAATIGLQDDKMSDTSWEKFWQTLDRRMYGTSVARQASPVCHRGSVGFLGQHALATPQTLCCRQNPPLQTYT